MNLLVSTLSSHRNLRAYRRAWDLASDLFWLTRRFPGGGRNMIADQLRRHAEAIPEAIGDAWTHRHDATLFHMHLNEALEACRRLALWLEVARACENLSPDEHRILTTRRDRVERLITLLRTRCGQL
ncbi:four helix bundle protein [Rhodocaloribacter litoris]|uniref:four helix bundle protein n=1 Tax=Rhodocaloribacter litoris TaxID=2558931 RepID=UPI00141EF77B|nr:four helix bundle protein [Rhodocaloribacter litoris]QXD14472.1 four helix bundle protein [Rhodocaloribacter litoris]